MGDLIDEREEQAIFERLKEQVAVKRAEMAETLTLAEGDRRDDALALVRSGRGKTLMNVIRTLISALDDHEHDVVAQRQARVRLTGALVVLSTMAAVVLLGVVALAALREVRRRSALARFLPADIAERLAVGDQSLREGGHWQEVACCGLRGRQGRVSLFKERVPADGGRGPGEGRGAEPDPIHDLRQS